jgi:[ribosomal protein S5]-alanine N-acetyltransferase
MAVVPRSAGLVPVRRIGKNSCMTTPQLPTLRTTRLVLRPFRMTDASAVQQLAGASEVASTTLNVPHPYEDGMADVWIATHPAAFASGAMATFAITTLDDTLVGAISLRLEPADARADLGYWIGVPHWGLGYATEAAIAVLAFGFDVLALHRIHASHLTRNPASGRVMQKAGLSFEGILRQHVLKDGHFEDLAKYGMLRTDARVSARTGAA